MNRWITTSWAMIVLALLWIVYFLHTPRPFVWAGFLSLLLAALILHHGARIMMIVRLALLARRLRAYRPRPTPTEDEDEEAPPARKTPARSPLIKLGPPSRQIKRDRLRVHLWRAHFRKVDYPLDDRTSRRMMWAATCKIRLQEQAHHDTMKA